MSEAANLKRRRAWFKRRKSARQHQAMTVVEHLGELRRRLIFSLAAFVVISIAAFIFYEPILEVIRRPFCELPSHLQGPQGCRLIFVRVLGGFMFRLKVTALAGLIFASPVWLYQVWAFIVPGLTSKERRYAIPFVVSSIALFAAGAVLAYISMPKGIQLLVSLGGTGLVPYIDAEEYLNFVGLMLLGFGITFELPLVLFFLGLAEVISVEQLKQHRKAAFVGIFLLAAIITPSQDPYTMTVLALPIYGLYEVTILVLKRVTRRRAARA